MMLTRFICRHLLGLPRTTRNVALARRIMSDAAECSGGLVLGLCAYPLLILIFAL